MGWKYVCTEYAVSHGIFRGLRIRDLRTGNVVNPGLELKARTLRTWAALSRIKFSSRRARVLAEQALFRDCGALVLALIDPIDTPLGYTDGKMLLEHFWRAGEMDFLREQSLES